MSNWFLCLGFLSLAALAQEETRKPDFQIDDRYKAGEHLIYDCQKKHFACVNLDGYTLCEVARTKSRELKQTELACAPLKSFQNKKSCLLTNYNVIERNAWKRFCFPK